MRLSNGPVQTSGQPARSAPGGETSPFAPKWVRDGRAQRDVVPLHASATPQLVPASAVDSPATPAAPRGPRPSGPELLAEDAVFKRLLQRHAPEPQPLAVKPEGDPLGHALGMVARLMVAGCAAAAVIVLSVGIIPLPFRFGPFMATEVTPADTSPPTSETTPAQRLADAAGITAPASTAGLGSVDAPAPARVPTVSVRVAPASTTDAWALDPAEVERLVKRGEDYLAQGDIAAARLILGRAAEAHDARAAFSLAATFDPSVLRQLHVVGFRPDVAQARAWYQKAAEYGSTEASGRLAALPNVGQ
jgi:hypothetical protein